MNTGIEDLEVSAYKIPTDLPESDGTIEWNDTTLILVRLKAGSCEGIGYTYGAQAITTLITSTLKPIVMGRDPADVRAINTAMVRAIRNNGQTGLAMMAISAVDVALWDLKARLLGLPLCRLLGQQREGMRIYGSGGFTSYTEEQLRSQLHGWVEEGIGAVKIKVGRDKEADQRRVAIARTAIGNATELYVDANGAYTMSEAVSQARLFSTYGVSWLEEPVPTQIPGQLALIRQHLNGNMRIVAGEYGYSPDDFRTLLTAGSVDVLQADATRCGGLTGFLKAGHLCEAFRTPLSSHCAPSIHLHAALSLPWFSIAEYFHDHVLIEHRLFDGPSRPHNGQLFPDLSRPGLGLSFRQQAADPYRVA
ncbi:MAG TPA: enolase C-terminal domain-like protein [Puia sp.]|nr:enolase C-terminal domain-like protein [Puia sp.]